MTFSEFSAEPQAEEKEGVKAHFLSTNLQSCETRPFLRNMEYQESRTQRGSGVGGKGKGQRLVGPSW